MMNGMESMPVESAMRPMSMKPQPPIGVIISSDDALVVAHYAANAAHTDATSAP